MAKNNVLIKSKLKKASIFVNKGKLLEAKSLYSQLYSKNKTNIEIALNLAIVHRKLGEYKHTESISADIIKKSPNNSVAHRVYGSALQCLGKLDSAINEYKKSIQLDDKLTDNHYYLGNIYQLTNQPELASESYRAAIRLNPIFFEALNNLGAVLVDLHKPIEAKKILNKAATINPNSIQLLCNLGNYHLLGNQNSEQALYYGEKAYKIDPCFVDALKLLGSCYFQKNNYEKALKYLKKANKIESKLSTIGFIAQILERQEKYEEANDLISSYIKSGNTDYSILIAYSSISRKFNNQQEAINAIENKISRYKFDKPSLIALYSELGKQYDFIGNFKEAFKYYKKANELERALNAELYSLNKTKTLNNTKEKNINKWFTDYPQNFWKNLPYSNNESSRPIFIIGMFRSGTTLCEQIISSHPDAYGAGELQDINLLSHSMNNQSTHDKSPASLINISEKKLTDAAYKYLKKLDTHSLESKKVIDKMPSNFFHVGLIAHLFPNAHIIHMVRNPLDTCLSMYFQRFGEQMPFSTDLIELAEYYLAYQRIMEYWDMVLDTKILNVVYEDLMENQELVTRNILTFCGLKWNSTCLNFHQNKRDINTPSYDQVRKPIYKKSVARWRNYANDIKPLISALNLN